MLLVLDKYSRTYFDGFLCRSWHGDQTKIGSHLASQGGKRFQASIVID